MIIEVHDHTRCLLGEGPLWHPEREAFLWCDILSRRVLTRDGGALFAYEFDDFPSAMGWVDRSKVLLATGSDMRLLDLDTGRTEHVCPLEEDNAETRSNDGRADPWGGFWIGTMGIHKGKGAGAIYRFWKGEMTKLRGDISIPNAICFSPDRKYAYFTDTPTQIVMRWALGEDGWPEGEPEPFIDEREDNHRPDGAVCDAEGGLWVSHWGSSRVAHYTAEGKYDREVRLPATQVTCPAFGGAELTTLYATTAAINLSEPKLTDETGHGKTYVVRDIGRGQAEHRVLL